MAQALALIPGTSRSGVTMTAGTLPGFTRPDAARFSFLLGIPATAAAGVLNLARRSAAARRYGMDELACAGLPSSPVSRDRLPMAASADSFLPFVLYRMALGGFLLGARTVSSSAAQGW